MADLPPRALRSRLAFAAAAALLASACGDARPIAAKTTAAACEACHLSPPDTGAHRAHAQRGSLAIAYGSLAVAEDVSPDGAARYEFGCGHCHPLDAAQHEADAGGDGLPDVVLAPPATPVEGDEVKARNDPAAAYDRVAQRCSGVYCHSSGQATPAYAESPVWTGAKGALGCDGCHGNPPRYASGGAGAADANSHIGLEEGFEWESGHFAGLPGPFHNPKHGGGYPPAAGPSQAANPITCQACHYDSVDPANVRAGGFFYLDTTGDYVLEGGDPTRFDNPEWLVTQCATCHDGVVAPLGTGAALPLRHVNGKRDVSFDRRTVLPAGYATGLPALATPEPVRPYYVTTASLPAALSLAPEDCATNPVPSCGVAADVAVRESAAQPVITLTLEHASYDPATKTCSSVACHLERQHSVDAARLGEDPNDPIPPLRWGTPFSAFPACNNCHLR